MMIHEFRTSRKGITLLLLAALVMDASATAGLAGIYLFRVPGPSAVTGQVPTQIALQPSGFADPVSVAQVATPPQTAQAVQTAQAAPNVDGSQQAASP